MCSVRVCKTYGCIYVVSCVNGGMSGGGESPSPDDVQGFMCALSYACARVVVCVYTVYLYSFCVLRTIQKDEMLSVSNARVQL